MGTLNRTRSRQSVRCHNRHPTILHRSNTEKTNMDDMLDSLAKQGRKFRQRLRGKKKPDKTGADNAEESVGPSSSLPQPAPHIAAGGHGGAGSRTSTNERQTRSGDKSPQPGSVSVGGMEEASDEKEVNKEHSPPDPDDGVVEDSGTSQEAERVHASPSSPPTPLPAGEPESPRTH